MSGRTPVSAPVTRRVSAWNIANALTVLRVLLVPVFGWLLLYDGGMHVRYRLFAAGVFVLASLTDRIDGDIARARGLVTDFGKVSDPIADKTLMGMAFVGLSVLGELSWWVTVVVLVREVAVTVLRFFVIRHGVIPASRGGKVKTVLQAVAAGLFVLPLSGGWRVTAVVVMVAAVGVTVGTGVDYVLRARRLRQTSPRALAKQARREAAALARADAVRAFREVREGRAAARRASGTTGAASAAPTAAASGPGDGTTALPPGRGPGSAAS
ncbi:MAG TPA: CDP-diacylglycerol--glycerol-3-phosphate 3-phosphatidyltransferase [Dermatophilaceae bacterium]|nr:CDP-diacylglycerol--glycerol-3-phosphate 3-phosphatidyltransferase [Dermatophilaceae bacterium]